MKLNDLKGNWFKLRHRPETALQSYYKAISLIDSSTDDRHKSILARDLAGVYTELNKPDSALKYLWRHLELEDTIDKVSHRDEVYAADMKQRLERAKLQNEMQLKSSRIMTVAVVCATIAVSLLVILIIHRRNSRRQLKALQTEAELRRTRHRVVARSATLEENRRLINNIRDLARDGAASDSLADEITKTLQLHDISEPERDTFMQINDRLDPDFRARLKNDFPSLSEAQLRMAQYIAIGMPNQHIARMLNISYDSVKKARWRLRSAMGLLRPQKLEDALRRYS